MPVIHIPFSLLVYKRAVKVNISGELIRSLAFIDLQILVLSLEIDNLHQYNADVRKRNLQKKGIKEVVQAKAEDYDSL